MNWNELVSMVYKTAEVPGFRDEEPCYEHQAMLVITELSGAIGADMRGRHADREKYKDMLEIISESILGFKERLGKRKKAFERCIKDTVEDKLADACIRLLDMMGHYGVGIIRDNEFTAGADKSLCWFCFLVSEALVLGERNALNRALSMILAYARHNNIDLEWHIYEKMIYNEQRPRPNKKKY